MPGVFLFFSLFEEKAIIRQNGFYFADKAMRLLRGVSAHLPRGLLLVVGLFQRVIFSKLLQGFPKIFAPFGEIILQTAIIVPETKFVDAFRAVVVQQSVDVDRCLVEMFILRVSQAENPKIDSTPIDFPLQLLLAFQNLNKFYSVFRGIAFSGVC